MKSITKKSVEVLIFSAVAVLTGWSLSWAGQLFPDASPAPTSYTLQDIYTRLTTNEGTVEGDHNLSSSDAVAGTFRTLKEIYEAIPDINAAKVLVGTSYLGIDGIVFKDMWNGSGDDGNGGVFPGGGQENGGVDDCNWDWINSRCGDPADDRYEGSWTQCVGGVDGNNYCGTGDDGADAMDDYTGLVWSFPCNGVGCDAFEDVSSPTAYSWDNSHSNNDGMTAQQLCSEGNHGKTGWQLPHQKQLMQAYINGSYGNLEASGVDRIYWSATTVSLNPANAWGTNLSDGSTGLNTFYDTKGGAFHVRCVRSAN